MSRGHDRLDRRRWAKARRETLERDGYRCRQCGRPGRLEVDHVQPLDKGGSLYDLGNLQALCRGCHIRKTAGENERPDPERDRWRALIARRVAGEAL